MMSYTYDTRTIHGSVAEVLGQSKHILAQKHFLKGWEIDWVTIEVLMEDVNSSAGVGNIVTSCHVGFATQSDRTKTE